MDKSIKDIQSIAVYCGSSEGNTSAYREAAQDIGQMLAEKNIELVYGGARIGLMGYVSKSCIEHGGRVIGVIPRFLQSYEIVQDGLHELILTETMHERKQVMSERCDAVIALPGGFGTMDELFEMLTWAQLGLHRKPIGLLNVGGFYTHFLRFVDEMEQTGFIQTKHRTLIVDDESPDRLLDKILALGQSEEMKKILPDQEHT
jgi:uncharacterized protein (TIGR00730 family)